MNAIMASPGGRAPPGQNMLTPCEESRSPVEVRGFRAPRPSASRPYRSERPPACHCRPPPSSPTPEESAPCSRSWLRPKRSSPIATDAHVRDPAPAAPRGNGPQARTCCLSACSWLHLLKSWSLRLTRSGSKLRRPFLALPDHQERTGQIVLRGGPIKRHALAIQPLQRLAIGAHGLFKGHRPAFAVS